MMKSKAIHRFYFNTLFPWILLLLSINFFTTLKTFTGFTSNIFMMALLLTPSRLIWRCILHNMITEGKIRLIRYNVWSSLVALMCILQFSVLPVKSNKKTLSVPAVLALLISHCCVILVWHVLYLSCFSHLWDPLVFSKLWILETLLQITVLIKSLWSYHLLAFTCTVKQ